ncbi:MAG: hypothetical protein IT437_12735 [Phycisphaerales bacterium]|nr:hypothetical protein [Phycisphaerales bacterium]
MLPRLALRILTPVMIAAVAVQPAHADDYVDRANALYAPIRADHRSDLVLLPLVAKMDPPPAAVDTPTKAEMLPAGSSAWSAAAAWAQAPNQQAVLKAIDQVTAEENPVEAMAFGQPYGVDAVASAPGGVDLVQAGLYTELGDPPMLAAAKFQDLPALDRAACLVHVEATRLAADGQPGAAMQLVTDWLFFSRQMVDRAFYHEAKWGMEHFITSLDRLRDIAYTDSKAAKPALTIDDIAAIQERIRENGYLRLDRAQFPAGNRIAAEQVVARVYSQQGPNPDTFAATMARLASTEHPLRLFSEAAKWEQLAQQSADTRDVTEQLARTYDDWSSRWQLSPFDPLVAVPTAYDKLSPGRFAVLRAALPDMGDLWSLRQVMEAQLVGTRDALGLAAFRQANHNLPLTLSALRPRYVRDIGSDPFNPTGRANGGQPPMQFFVPIRDTRARFGPRETPRPHEINVFTPGGEANFRAPVGEDQFVLYSVGPNGRAEWADNATGVPVKDSIGDILFWPPFISLYREELVNRGTLK